jgi:sulfur-oxidizing protein SoxY
MSSPFSQRFASDIDRRQLVVGGVALVATVTSQPVRATPDVLAQSILGFTGGAEPREGKVTLDIAPLVENGNAVGVEVRVDHPMKADDFVTEIALFTEKNPAPEVAVFHLTPRSGRAHVITRMRLATTQRVAAVARLSDGTCWQEVREVIVTIAACLEE